MLRIEIVSSMVDERSGAKKDGSGDYHMRMQEGYLHNGHAYPERFTVVLGKDADGRPQKPYAPGFYTLSQDAIGVDRKTGRLGFAFDVRLEKLNEAPRAATAVAGK